MRPQRHVLDNGIQFITDSMQTVESVALYVLFKVGSRYEANSKDGISHLLEHMMFKGTKKRSAKEIAEAFEEIGGRVNAYTDRECTVYHVKILKEYLGTAAEILSDMISNSTFDPEELEREKQVVLQEISQVKDNPSSFVWDRFEDQVLAGQQAGKAVIGTVESVSTTTREDVVGYINRNYIVPNTIIGISGNIQEGKAREMMNGYFGGLKNSGKSDDIEEAKYVGGEILLERDIEQTHVVLGFKGISYHDEEYYVLQVASIIAGYGMSSRLFQEVREKRGLAYSISAQGVSYSDFGYFSICASSKHETVNELIKVTIGELHKMCLDVSEEEVQKAKVLVRTSLLMAQESTNSRAGKLVSDYAIFGRFISTSEILEKISKVDVNSVKAMMARLMKNGSPTLSAIGHLKDFHGLDTISKML